MNLVRKFKDELFVTGIFFVWRTVLLLVSFVASQILPFRYSFPYAGSILIPSGLPQWLWSWGNFDGVHYLTLASQGYDGFGTQVFFPLYPMLASFLSWFVRNEFTAAFIISNSSFLIAAILLFRLVKKYFDRLTAKWAVTFLFAFPVSFFFGSIYTESLFLLLVLAAFWARGLWAGVFGALASGTRLVGLFVGPALVLARKRNIWGLLSFSGLGLYILYLWWRFGRPLFFLSAQSAFGSRTTTVTGLVTPFQVVFRYVKIFLTVNVRSYDFWVAALEFAAFAFGLAILCWLTVKKKTPREWLLFSWPAFILPSLSGTLSSMPRYLLTIFPIFIGLAIIKNKPIKLGILALFIVLLLLLTCLFTRGYFVS